MENLAVDRKKECLAGACCGFCDFFMTRDARLKDRISVARSSGCSLVYPSQQALITQFPQVGDCVTRKEYTIQRGTGRHDTICDANIGFIWPESISGRVREPRECLHKPFKCSHLPKTKLLLRNKGGTNKASHGGLAVALVAIYIQMHWWEFA